MILDVSQLALVALACSLVPEVAAQPVIAPRQPLSILGPVTYNSKYCKYARFGVGIPGCPKVRNPSPGGMWIKKVARSEPVVDVDDPSSFQPLTERDPSPIFGTNRDGASRICNLVRLGIPLPGCPKYKNILLKKKIARSEPLSIVDDAGSLQYFDDAALEARDIPVLELVEDGTADLEARGEPEEFELVELNDSEE